MRYGLQELSQAQIQPAAAGATTGKLNCMAKAWHLGSGPGQEVPEGLREHKLVLKAIKVGEDMLYFKTQEIPLPDFPAGLILGGQISSRRHTEP